MNIQTKIIATIGPSTLDFETFQAMLDAGVDFIRINTAYGDTAQYDQIVDNLEKAKKVKEVKVILDVKKLEVLNYAVKNNLDTIALSFAESSEQIEEIKNVIPNAFVISKIETEKGVQNFDEILEHSEGIMVARGDLGHAVKLEKVPPLQKEFTQKTLAKNKFLIAATEMLLSMTENLQPTRAEVSDVANAVFDFSSAVMLSEETAIGKHPAEAVSYMQRIIGEAEKWNKENVGRV